MYHTNVAIAAMFSASLLGGAVLAAPVAYDEAVGGDLVAGISFANGNGFTLDVGLNTITGSASTVGPDTGFDNFGVVFGTGLRIVGGSFTANNTGAGNFNINSSAVPTTTGVFQDVLGPGVSNIAFLPFNSGSVFRVNNQSTSPVDYTFTFEVAPVPLPAPVALLGAALLGLGVAARKARRG